MIKFVKYQDLDNHFDKTKIIMKTDAITLGEIITDFENFLRACGYVFEGELDFVNNEIPELLDEEE